MSPDIMLISPWMPATPSTKLLGYAPQRTQPSLFAHEFPPLLVSGVAIISAAQLLCYGFLISYKHEMLLLCRSGWAA